jgi:LPXTG-site transpeptidase (sortase) family protein
MNTFSEQEIEKLWKPFVVVLVFSFLIINWADVSWVFNYRAVSNVALEYFQTALAGNSAEEEEIAAGSDEGEGEILRGAQNDEERGEIAASRSSAPRNDEEAGEEVYVNLSNRIEIPKIGILAPLIFVNNSNNGYLHDKLDSGVVHFPGSAKPGESGQTIVLGHSAPPNWPKIKYDWVFSRLNELSKGDQIILFYNNQKYVYSVTRKVFLNKGEEMPEQGLTNNNNTLISISCWPPGKDYKRIAVESALK